MSSVDLFANEWDERDESEAYGGAGAHQLRNDAGEPARLLIVSTLRIPSMTRYPDSEKLSARWSRERAALFRRGDEVDYRRGES